jgi:hypothetical protein
MKTSSVLNVWRRLVGSGRKTPYRRRRASRALRLEPLEQRQLLTAYYVNDLSNVHDQWATAKASVQAILSRYDLEPGDRVRIDTGT